MKVMKSYDILVNIVKVLRFTVLVGRMPHAPLVQTVISKQYKDSHLSCVVEQPAYKHCMFHLKQLDQSPYVIQSWLTELWVLRYAHVLYPKGNL